MHTVSVTCTNYKDSSDVEVVSISNDHSVFETSECLNLCKDDTEMSIPVSIRSFTRYTEFREWKSHHHLYAEDDLCGSNLQQLYQMDCEVYVDVYDAALRLCDMVTLNMCVRMLCDLTDLYFNTAIVYIKTFPPCWVYDLIFNRLLIPTVIVMGNLHILRDILTNMSPEIYIHIASDPRGLVYLKKTMDVLAGVEHVDHQWVYYFDEFMVDCLRNYSKVVKFSDAGLVLMKYIDGDEKITPHEMAIFVKHAESKDKSCGLYAITTQLHPVLESLMNLHGVQLNLLKMLIIRRLTDPLMFFPEGCIVTDLMVLHRLLFTRRVFLALKCIFPRDRHPSSSGVVPILLGNISNIFLGPDDSTDSTIKESKFNDVTAQLHTVHGRTRPGIIVWELVNMMSESNQKLMEEIGYPQLSSIYAN